MSLNTLNRLDPRTADGVLAAAVLALGNSTLDPIPEKFRLDAEALIREAGNQLSIDTGELSPAGRQKIRSLLSSEVTRRLRTGTDVAALEQRLGSEGKLPLGAYKIESTDVFKSYKETIKFAVRCVRENDGFEHLYSSGASDGKQVSVFCKSVENKKGSRPQWVIVITSRKGDVLKITSLYRVFPERVEITNPVSPMGIFSDFLNVYGEEIRFGNLVLGRGLIKDVYLPHGNAEFSIPLDHSNTLEVMPDFEYGRTKIVYAFAVNTGKYAADKILLG